MASDVQICNMALSHLGAEARVASISPPDGSAEAGYCATFYDVARTEMIEPGHWAFALKREALARTTNLSNTWLFAYVLPSDCLRALRVLMPGAGITVFTQDIATVTPNDHPGADFDIEGTTLFTNEEDAVLLYARDVIDSGKFPASFTSALSYLLASYLAGPIIKGNDGARMGDTLRARAMALASIADVASANASSTGEVAQASIVAVRA